MASNWFISTSPVLLHIQYEDFDLWIHLTSELSTKSVMIFMTNGLNNLVIVFNALEYLSISMGMIAKLVYAEILLMKAQIVQEILNSDTTRDTVYKIKIYIHERRYSWITGGGFAFDP
ncbi:hypothetical protein ACJX0J_038312 [Zea mays]